MTTAAAGYLRHFLFSEKNKDIANREDMDEENHYVCTCGKSYALKSSLKNHQKFFCGKKPQFVCPVCGYASFWKGNVKAHFNKHDTTVPWPY